MQREKMTKMVIKDFFLDPFGPFPLESENKIPENKEICEVGNYIFEYLLEDIFSDLIDS